MAPKKAPETVAIESPKRMKFYAKKKKIVLSVALRDEEGNIIPSRDASNMPIYRNGQVVPVYQVISFSTEVDKPEKYVCSFVWTADMQNASVILDELTRLQELGTLLSEEAFERSRNAEAYEAKKKIRGLEDQNADLVAELEAARAQIALMQR